LKKSILYIGGFELPDKNAAAHRVVSNAKAFRDLGYYTFLIGLSRDKSVCNRIEIFEGFEYINLEYPADLKQWLSYLTSIKQYSQFINDDKLTMIIAYNFPAIALYKLRKWTLKENIPLIADCTEWYEATGNIFFRLLKSLDTSLRMKKIHPKLDGMIAISHFLYRYYNSRMNNVIEVPPLVDLNMNKWNLVEKTESSEEIVNIVYAGSPGAGGKDRLDIILQILSQIKKDGFSKFRFIVIGIAEDQYKTSFATDLPLNIRENIFFKGRMSHIDSLSEVKKAHFNLFIRENSLVNNAGFPTKLAESISCGTPVLTNATSNIEDYITNGVNGFLIDTTSRDTLQKGIEEAITLPFDRIRIMKDICYRSQPFNYTKYLSNFDLLIKNLKSS